MKALLDNQIKAIDKLRHYKVGALFMEPGTGKTLTAWRLIKSVPGVDYVLWLTPFQTKENLFVELNKMDADTSIIEIQGIESLSNSDRLYLELLPKVQKAKRPFIIVDESLKIKNSEAIRTMRAINIGRYANYKLVLNGSPVSRKLLDLWAQMEFLSPKILQMGFAEFKNTFVEYTTITKRMGHKVISKEFINKYHNVDYLYSLIGPFVFDAKLELNKKQQYVDIDYSLTDEEEAEHNRLKEKYLDDEHMEFRNNNIFLEITQKLQHNYSLSPEKIDIIEGLTKKEPERFIVYAKYIDTQEKLRKLFPKLRIMSWQKHAFGLNLQQYNRVIFFDKVWDYALRDQAEHRVYRVGQQEDCIFYDLTGNVGLEKMINENINKKQNLLEYFKKKSVKELMKKL